MPEVAGTHPSPRQLAEYALGKLDADPMTAITDHLADCAACRETVDAHPPDSFVGQLQAAGRAGSLPPGDATPLPQQLQADERTDDPPASLAQSGKYEVLGKLGQGGMGSVWKARHTFLRQLVAIKVMNAEIGGHADARARFLREMRATARLSHKHIVRALDAEALGDHLILVMEYVEGITLDKLVGQKGTLPIAYACRWVAQAAEALQHAHAAGMVHRDVKPHNLIVTRDTKEVKVLDFGLARGPRELNPGGARTQLQVFLGTPDYVAPEQATDARNADVRADVYSLGCTLYFLLTGRPPFQRANALETIVAQVQDTALPVEQSRQGVSPDLGAVVAKMMAKAREDRYQTPREVAEALRPFFNESGRSLPPPLPWADEPLLPAARRPRTAPTKGRAASLVAILALLLALPLLAWGVLTVETSDGKAEVRLELNEPGWAAAVEGDSITLTPADGKGPLKMRVEPGKVYKFKVEKDGFETVTDRFVYKKGGKPVVEAIIRAKPAVKGAVRAEEKPGHDEPAPGATPPPRKLPVFPVVSRKGEWSVKDGEVYQSAVERPALLLFGSPDWKDVQISCEVYKGAEGEEWPGTGVVTRAANLNNYYYFEVGAFGNKLHDLEAHEGRGFRRIGVVRGSVPHNTWLPIAVKVAGDRFECSLMGKQVVTGSDDRRLSGLVGLRAWGGRVRFRNVKVTGADGKVLLEGLPDLPQHREP